MLKKELNLVDVFAVASGAMISSGLFILPGLAFAKSGPAVILAYVIAAMLVIPAVLSNSELVTAMPKAGGVYFFIDRSFGPLVGTMGGLSSWFSLSFKSAFALTGMSYFMAMIFPGISPMTMKYFAALLCVFFTCVNLFSLKSAGRFQVALVFSLIALLLIYIVRGFHFIDMHSYTPFMPYGFKSVLLTASYVFVSFGGLTKIACIAEEIKDPSKNIPLGMILSFIIVSTIYVFVIFITVGIADPTQLAHSKTPISTVAAVILARPGMIMLSFAALFAFVSTANAGIMTASRDPLAISRDGLLPSFFSDINKKFNTPHFAIIATGFFMVMVVMFLNLESLVKAASSLQILLFIFGNLSLISMRESRMENYQPKFKSPLYPWIQISGIIGCLMLLIAMGQVALITVSILSVVSVSIYWMYGKKRATREFALIHLVERIMDKKLAKNILESELKEIIRQRDNIVVDRFDDIIESCSVIDIDKRIELEEFLKLSSEIIADRTSQTPELIYDALLKREQESSTVLSDFLAIPHIVVENSTDVFEILVARCKEGILFSNTEKYIKAVFILIGSPDQRNFHLKALSAIAQIVQNPKFQERWLAAGGEENLRDIILLGTRNRQM